jgi:diguanylate cyclase (GGDEF)-like protein
VLGNLATSREIYHLAFHDTLTGLPNVALFRERATQALLMGHRLRTPVGIAVADVDRFKEINDTFGHAMGDAVLRQVGSRLAESLRGSDTVARLGGDEFGILLPSTSREGVERAARKLRGTLARGLWTEGGHIIHVSLGYAISSTDMVDFDNLLKAADDSLYRAKRKRTHAVQPRAHKVTLRAPSCATEDLQGVPPCQSRTSGDLTKREHAGSALPAAVFGTALHLDIDGSRPPSAR